MTLSDSKPFLAQAHTNGHSEAAIARYSFNTSEPAKLPIVQTVKRPPFDYLRVSALTPRETEVLALQGQGLSIKGIARQLSISPGTVKWHVKNVYEKLYVTSREDALFKARLRQII